MDHDQVRKLEDGIEKAIVQTVRRLSQNRAIPKPASDRTYHLMAKAAAAVFEAVVEEQNGGARQQET